MNYKLIANQISDLLKWGTTINEIGRAAQSVLTLIMKSFLMNQLHQRELNLFMIGY